METNKKLIKALFSYLGAAFAVILMACIPGGAHADACFAFSYGGVSASVGTGGSSCGLGDGGIGQSLCNIVSWFQAGGIGAAVASLAVIFMGIAAFFGKVTWGMAIVTAAAIFSIFGAEEIVNAIVGGDVTSGCGSLGGSGVNVTAAFGG